MGMERFDFTKPAQGVVTQENIPPTPAHGKCDQAFDMRAGDVYHIFDADRMVFTPYQVEEWVNLGKPGDDMLVRLKSPQNALVIHLSNWQIAYLEKQGRIMPVDAAAADGRGGATPGYALSIKGKRLEKAEWMLLYIDAVFKAFGEYCKGGRSRKVMERAVKDLAEKRGETPPSMSALYEKLARLRKDRNFDRTAAVADRPRRGNQTPRKPNRAEQAVREAVEDTIFVGGDWNGVKALLYGWSEPGGKYADLPNLVRPQIPKFLEGLEEFWGAVTDASHYHIQDMQSTKAVYGGDLFPSYDRNIASSAGLYIDTIVLSDPFWHSRHIFQMSPPETQVYYLVKHAVNVMGYRDLATAKLDNPIVVVTPFRSSVDESEIEFLKGISERDGVAHAHRLFGREFENIDDLFAFCNQLDTPEKAAAHIADRDRFLFDTDWTGSMEEQIARAFERDGHLLPPGSGPGQVLASQCVGRMMQATDILLKSRYLGGTPLMDAPTSWKYFNWKLEYNSSITPDNTHLHMVKGLQRAAETDMEWLGNIPPAALIEMRQQGAFHEIRDVLSAGVSEIAEAKPDAFFRSSDKIVENIQEAFDQHQRNVKELRNKGFKFAGHDLGSWISVGAIEIAAIATGTPFFGVAAFAANQILDVPKLKELPERFRELKNAHQELKKSPMGLLFAHKD